MGKNVSEDGGQSLRVEFSISGNVCIILIWNIDDKVEGMVRSSIFLKSYRILTNNIAKERQLAR